MSDRKQQYTVKLTGMVDGKPAKTHQADDVMVFHGDSPMGHKNYFIVDNTHEGTPTLITPKGRYPMLWNNAGYFEPATELECKIHVSLKRITGKLIYWA